MVTSPSFTVGQIIYASNSEEKGKIVDVQESDWVVKITIATENAVFDIMNPQRADGASEAYWFPWIRIYQYK